MSDYADSYTVPGDWAYMAAYLTLRAHVDEQGIDWDINAITAGNGISLAGKKDNEQIASMVITGERGKTYITTSCINDSQIIRRLETLKAMVIAYGKYVVSLQRLNTTQQFRAILDDYYERWAEGRNTKLKAIADEYGVNYGSLRQAKIRYDDERRKNASDE